MFLLCWRISKHGDELNAKCTSEPENARMPPWNNTLEMRTTEPIQQEHSEPYCHASGQWIALGEAQNTATRLRLDTVTSASQPYYFCSLEDA